MHNPAVDVDRALHPLRLRVGASNNVTSSYTMLCDVDYWPVLPKETAELHVHDIFCSVAQRDR